MTGLRMTLLTVADEVALLLGIGIQTRSVEKFSQSIVINDVKDPKA